MKKIHFMGIGGSGINAVAGIAHADGYEVTGCDIKESDYTADLVSKAIPIFYGHSAAHVESCDLLCISPAVSDLNPHHEEVVFAREHSIPTMTWQEFMGTVLQAGKRVIAVTGTKGKTTTTALAGLLLEKAGYDPIVEVGGTVKEWGRNYRVGEGSYFVCEADEFNNNFFHITPEIVILTNLEMDHPEFFKDYAEYIDAFIAFVKRIPDKGVLIANTESPGVVDLLSKIDTDRISVITYGKNSDSNMLVSSVVDKDRSTVVAKIRSKEHAYKTSLSGEHNALNIMAILTLADYLGISTDVSEQLLASVAGIGRRFELIGERNGAVVYNDYAHNPMSVRAALKTAREMYPDSRIWAVFQPHLYSRTKMFLEEFALAFGGVEKAVITDIYASREKGKAISQEIHSKDLVAKIHALNPSIEAHYIGDLREAAIYLLNNIGPEDVVINMGAGDNGIITDILCQKIQ